MNRPDPSEDVKKEQRTTTKPCVSLNSCVKHPPTEQREEKSIPTHAMPRQYQVYSTVKTKQEKKRQRAKGEDEERKRAMRHILKANAAPYCY